MIGILCDDSVLEEENCQKENRGDCGVYSKGVAFDRILDQKDPGCLDDYEKLEICQHDQLNLHVNLRTHCATLSQLSSTSTPPSVSRTAKAIEVPNPRIAKMERDIFGIFAEYSARDFSVAIPSLSS
jgi:hypothetical protein